MFEQQLTVSAVAAIVMRDDVEVSRLSDFVAAFISGEQRVDLSVRTMAPETAAPGQVMSFVTVVTNNGPAAIARFVVDIPRTTGTLFVDATTTSGACWLGGLQICEMRLLGAGETATIVERVQVIGGGTLQHKATAAHWP